ncbi:MAG: 2-C-methyl-D-erythritol 2,4-cyclodiphosphate synthase [Clostridiales bacterium]|nr:2-C-methyl-D-erythritol 2,4-cyclodiphosphate synthase [Clostridiales bacterium]
MRIGHGYDVHRFSTGRKLILGGVEIPSELGLLGHSDADVLTHAIMDAILGALGLGDIGRHFPDTDDAYKSISSLLLAERLLPMLKATNMQIVNIDATIIAQYPKLAPYIQKMREKLSAVFRIDQTQINIKATTEEGLGFTGAKQGIAAHALCLLASEDKN